ncbi:MAG: TraR/DksA family transcriptional regulator [Planctomycetota bacterium]|jgi:RNA polymerase-binding protein DksA
MKKADREKWKKKLLERRSTILADLRGMEESARAGSGGASSSMPLHMADVSADNYELDITFGLIEAEQAEIRQIDDALGRIEDGTFGKCEECEVVIPGPRLNAIPHARLCIDCKRKEEEGLL